MGISVDLARRYRIESESYIDNTGNGSFHNHYEYYDRLVPIEPTEDDVISYQGKKVCKGRFLGHPNDDKSLYLVKSGSKTGLYEDEQLLMDGDNLFIYGDLCVQFDEGTYYIVDLKDNSEICSVQDASFVGYDIEHKAFAFGDKVYTLDGDKLTEYHGDAKMLKFDLPVNEIKAEAHIEKGAVCQTNQYESIAQHNYTVGVQNSDGRLLVFARTSEDKEADKKSIIDLYIKKLVDYDGSPAQKEEINTIKQVYSILYNEDISGHKDKDGRTLFEKLLCGYDIRSSFWALRDFYLDDFKKETDTKLSVSFSSYELDKLCSKHKLSDDDKKLIADFIARNPQVLYSFSDESFLALAKANPDMVVEWVKYSSGKYDTKVRKIEDLKKLGSSARSLAGEILEKNGIQFYFKEDFVLAPNKEFWEIVKDREFGEPRIAFGRLCEALNKFSDKDSFSYVTTKKMLIEFMDKNPGVASYQIMNWYEDDYKKFLVENGLTQDEKNIAEVTSPRAEPNLNEMLIRGKGKEVAYALSHGASPFQKIESAGGKRTDMPFAGVFLRKLKEGFSGVQPLMNEIARNLDAKSGQQIIADIEKSLGQNLRQIPAVTQIMKNMRETFMHARLENEKKYKEELEKEQKRQKDLDDSRKFKKEHQQKLDELDKAYRVANGKKVDEYHILFDGETMFKFGRYSEKLLYTQENIERVKDEIVKIEEHNRLIDEVDKKLHAKDENTGKTLLDRFHAFDYHVYLTDEGVMYRHGNDHYSDTTIPYSKDTIATLDEFIAKQEEKLRIEQEQEAERQRLLKAQEEERQRMVQYKAMGLPSDVRVWHRVGAGTDCSDAWVIKPDGSFREPTKFEAVKRYGDGYKNWEQIFPGEVVLSWEKGNTAAEHGFEVIYMPKEGLTAAQKEAVLKIEEDIQNAWKDRRGLSSGIPSPDVGMGWNIAGRKMPLKAKRDVLPEPVLEDNIKPEPKVDTKVQAKENAEPDREITMDDLARLKEFFGR